MIDTQPTLTLSARDIALIQERALEKLGATRKSNEVIGIQIFDILGRHARVLYYPLGLNAPWGLADINGSNVFSKPFVVINTSHAIAQQVFSAAHELYHIWYDLRFDVVTSEVLDPAVLRGEEEVLSELKANRFAAEFLINEHTLLKEITMNEINVKDIGAKDILLLSSVFNVPYRTMARRFLEIEAISQSRFEELDSKTPEELLIARKRYAIEYSLGDGRVSLDNLVDLSLTAYEKSRITFEKLEYLLSFPGLETEAFGVSEPQRSSFPSDKELDELMGE